MSPLDKGGYTLSLPGFDNDAHDYPDLFAETSPAPAPEFEAPQPALLSIPSAWRPTVRASGAPTASRRWPVWDDQFLLGLDGQVTKFDANVAAIAVLGAIERSTLLRYTGWGGIPASFNEDGRDALWSERASRLRQLLSADDHDSARASVNNSHYTDPLVIHWIWSLLGCLGFRGGKILEPSAGVGHFLGCMPTDMAHRSRITAVEIDRISGRILGALYAPYGVDVRGSGLESTTLADGTYDLVVSNVPFGRYGVLDNRNRPYSRASIHNWFVGRT